MCTVKDINDSEKRISIVLKNGVTLQSDWYKDNNELIEDCVNCTVDQKERYVELLKQNNYTDDDVKEWYTQRKREDGVVYITHHAFERIKERCGLNKKAAYHIVQKAYDNGTDISEIKGYLLPWAKKKLQRFEKGERALVYGDFVYTFKYDTLITVIRMPQKGKITQAFSL